MNTNVATLTAKLTADTSGLKRGFGQADRDLKGFSSKSSAVMKGLGTAAVAGAAVAGAAITGVAVKGVAAFADFERGMNEVFTLLPDITEDAMGEMEKEVKDFAKEFGVLPDKVVPALYQALSAGVPKDNVFEFMEQATKMAVGGAVELETAVDGLTSVVNAYGQENITAAEASDIMFTTIRLGKTTADELSRSLFQVNPVAAALGVKFEDVSAALAAMTAQGTPTRVATTQLRQAFVELGKEGSIAFDHFKDATGSTFPDFIAKGGTVEEAFLAMKGKAAEMGVGVGDLFGSVEAGMGVISLTSESGAAAFGAAMSEMEGSAGATEAAFGTMDQGLGRTMDRIKALFATALIDIGGALAPLVEKFADFFEAELPEMIDVTVDLFGSLGEVIEALFPMFKSLIKAVGGFLKAAKPIADVVAWLWDGVEATKEWGTAMADSEHPSERFVGTVAKLAASNLPDALAEWKRQLWKLPWADVKRGASAAEGPVSDLSKEMLALKRKSKSTTDDAGDDWREFAEGMERWNEYVGDELDDSVDDFVEWEREVAASQLAAESALFDSTRGIISMFRETAEQVDVSVDDMITTLLETRAASTRYAAVMRELVDAGFTALASELDAMGPAYTLAFERLMADGAQRGSVAWQANLDLQAGIIAAATMGKISADEVGHEIGGLLARGVEAGFDPVLPDPTVTGGTITWVDRYAGPAGTGRAMGGPVSAGVPYTVGERGPETFVPSQSGSILPHGATGGTTVIVEGNVFGAATVDDLADILTDAQIRQGRAGV